MISIIDFLVDLAGDVIGELIGHLIPDRFKTSKLEKNIERLKEEDWFFELEKDYRYAYIIYENRKVKRFLTDGKNLKLIISVDEEREKFIKLVKEEHEKFTGLR